MNFSRLRQYRQPWAIALVLALLWLTGWGQVHRVLHLGNAAPALVQLADTAGGKAAIAGHEDGGSLCQLLDHLSHGDSSTPAPLTWLAPALPQDQPPQAVCAQPVLTPAAFQARGPPHLA